MCGLAGIYAPAGLRKGHATAALAAMGDALVHRGPDAGAAWLDAAAGIGFAHRRLAIVDLSPAGAQPMASPDGRFMIAYNGEIYNHLELREQLGEPATGWRGHSDTETLLVAIGRWGLAGALTRAVGMFALALWDAQDRTLTLARDRLGEKPLYWGWQGEGDERALVFGSELKALRAYPRFDRTIDPAAIASLMRWGYVAAPRSIYSGAAKLMPGYWLRVGADGKTTTGQYWSPIETIRASRADPLRGSLDDSADALEGALRRAISGQMLADVPLGALLSGGIDSSTVVALMQALSDRPVQTFSIGFEEARFDESPYARAVAAHLGTEHRELVVTAADALALIPQLPRIYDEPFADSSQLPTILLSRMARTQVTVALSGDGGDELFGGYDSHRLIGDIFSRTRLLGHGGRKLAAAIAGSGLAKSGAGLAGRGGRHSSRSEQLNRLARVLRADDEQAAGSEIAVRWPDAPLHFPAACDRLPERVGEGATPSEELMALDARRYLPDDILVKVDRAAMSCSLETRVPLLDHRVFELAWRMPLAHKLIRSGAKLALRKVLARHVPDSLIDRPKAGFSVPIAQWLRGPLREWAGDLLDPARLRREGWLDEKAVGVAFSQHQSGAANVQAPLWSVLMFQAWLAQEGGN